MGRSNQYPPLEEEQLSAAEGHPFHPDSDNGAVESSVPTTISIPDASQLATAPDSNLSCSQGKTRNPRGPEYLPDFSDDPNDDTDEDLADVPLDYGRSIKTKRRGTRIEQRWHKFCRVKTSERKEPSKWIDAHQALREVTPNDIHRFLNYCLKLKYGQGGRHLKGMKKASALRADWKTFRGYYRKVTRSKISQDDSEEVNAGIRSLIDKFNLDTQEREKTAVYIHDLTEFTETILQTQEKRFYVGYERIQLCMFTMLGIYTVNRLSALLSLQFKHLQFSIQKDPHGGPPVLLAEIRSEHTKQFLGLSQLNNFPLPEIIDDPSLIFSPHVFLFGTLFWLDAFEAPSLTSMERLRELLVEGGRQQMQLPLKPEIEEYYLFCKTEMVDGDVVLQWNQPMNESTLSGRLNSLGLIHGWLHSMFAHRFHYGGGKMLNESGAVSEAQQNLIMKHADIRTFLDHYLPHNIDTDMQSIMNGRDPNTTLMRAITRMSRWIDKRRPRHLSDKQRASIRQHPDYLEAVRRRDQQARAVKDNPTPQMQSQLDKLSRAVTNTFNRISRVLRETTRKEFDRKQEVIDIERQLSGAAVNDKEAKEVLQNEDQMLPDQIHLLKKLLTWPTSRSLETEWQRRNAAVRAVTKYCSVHEGGPLRGRPKRKAATEGFNNEQPAVRRYTADGNCMLDLVHPQDNMLQKAEKHIRTAERPKKCFQCYGDGKLPDHRRAQGWTEYKSTIRHFRSKHLNDRRCNFCETNLLHEMHLRNHAAAVHRLVT